MCHIHASYMQSLDHIYKYRSCLIVQNPHILVPHHAYFIHVCLFLPIQPSLHYCSVCFWIREEMKYSLLNFLGKGICFLIPLSYFSSFYFLLLLSQKERLSEDKKPVCCRQPASDAREQLVQCSGVGCKCSGGNCQCQSSV